MLPPITFMPEPMISGDGEVGLLWLDNNTYIDVGFDASGLVTYYSLQNKTIEKIENDLPLDRQNLAKLLQIIISTQDKSSAVKKQLVIMNAIRIFRVVI